nr:chemotaxis response regulator protein-glutamate methylesterase [Piscibacillus halophilus]
MRKMISDMINQSDGMEVVDTARNGRQALEKIKTIKPDVVTLDVEMPEIDGLSVLKEIMKIHPIPVIMLSSLTQKGADITVQAIENGAIDFISKPSGSISLNIEDVKEELISKINLASRANLKTGQSNHFKRENPKLIYSKSLVAIGVSTGGPKALQTVLCDLPHEFKAPVIIVQHMPPKFTLSLAKRLNKISNLSVVEAQSGEILIPGKVYIAPGGQHLSVKQVGQALVFETSQHEFKSHYRPSIDYMFESLSHISGYNIISTILTGMGSDGVKGLKSIKNCQASNYVIAESKETAVINGMPNAAINQVGVDTVLPIDQIGQVITDIISQRGRE